MKVLTAIALGVLLTACGRPAIEEQPVVRSSDDAAATITAADMRNRIAFLASDALRGRDTPSPGLDSAAAYIVREFQRLGLTPAGENGTYDQRYPYTVRAVSGEPRWSGLTYGSDYFVSPGAAQNIEGELAVVHGALADAPPASIAGKVAVVAIKGRMDRSWRSALTSARNAAQRAGARGLIVVLDSSLTAENIRQAARSFSRTTSVDPVPALAFVRPQALQNAAGRVSIEVPASVNEHRPPNVVAMLRGSDPNLRDTYVVISAHMDHVGVGAPDATGDSIYNGADDDASGTSAVLEIAEAVASQATRPARSVIFLLVSGEEKGLLGSRYYSDHPTVPIESIVANINLDMIGRNAPDSVVVIGQEYSSLGPLLHQVVQANPRLGLTASRDLWPEQRFFFRSDHYNFARKEIPALFFFAGVHEDYHRPSDEVEKIDADKAARIARLGYYVTREIANRAEPPRWTEQGLREIRALTR